MRLLVIGLVALAALAGCGKDEPIGARPADSERDAGNTELDSGTPPKQDSGKPPEPDAGPPIRTIEIRNPFGGVLEQNLLVDGDFELTSGTGQYGWRALAAEGDVDLVRETGGLCRSGVTCGVLTPSANFVGFGAAAPHDQAMQASFWAKPAEPDCEIVSASVISCSSAFAFKLASVPPVKPAPDASGWCEYRGEVPPMVEQPCLFLGMRSTSTRALIDDAALVEMAASGSRHFELAVPGPELRARMERALKWIHDHQRFGAAPAIRP